MISHFLDSRPKLWTISNQNCSNQCTNQCTVLISLLLGSVKMNIYKKALKEHVNKKLIYHITQKRGKENIVCLSHRKASDCIHSNHNQMHFEST